MNSILEENLWKKMVTINKEIIPTNTALKDMINERHSIVHEYGPTIYAYHMLNAMYESVIFYLEVYLEAVKILRDKQIKKTKKLKKV